MPLPLPGIVSIALLTILYFGPPSLGLDALAVVTLMEFFLSSRERVRP